MVRRSGIVSFGLARATLCCLAVCVFLQPWSKSDRPLNLSVEESFGQGV